MVYVGYYVRIRLWLPRRREKFNYPLNLPFVISGIFGRNMNKDKRYYVYLHRNKNGKVFYIGKGTNKRAYDVKSRTKKWKEESALGYHAEIIKDNLNYSEAEDLEATLLNNPDEDWELVNSVKSRIPADLVEVSSHVYYDTSSITYLKWKFETVRGKRKLNMDAGSVGRSGYVSLMIDRKAYLAHRIIWVLFNDKEIPRGYVINHIDCNPSNNAISNLELVTFTENNRRKKCHKLETTGVRKTKTCPRGKGVFYSYTGSCTINGKIVNKSFAILKHGEQEALRLATEWRKEQIRLLNEQGAGYTERHGT